MPDPFKRRNMLEGMSTHTDSQVRHLSPLKLTTRQYEDTWCAQGMLVSIILRERYATLNHTWWYAADSMYKNVLSEIAKLCVNKIMCLERKVESIQKCDAVT